MSTDDHRPDDDRAALWEAVGNTFRPYAGWLFYGAGALLVLVGWIGISGESVVAKQLPYLISGGIGGVLLAVLGAYFLGIEELRRDSGRLDRMERQIEELHAALLARPDAPPPEVPPDDRRGRTNGHDPDALVVVEAGESFHRRGCPLTDGKVITPVTPAEATGQRLRPCPLGEPAVPAV